MAEHCGGAGPGRLGRVGCSCWQQSPGGAARAGNSCRRISAPRLPRRARHKAKTAPAPGRSLPPRGIFTLGREERAGRAGLGSSGQSRGAGQGGSPSVLPSGSPQASEPPAGGSERVGRASAAQGAGGKASRGAEGVNRPASSPQKNAISCCQIPLAAEVARSAEQPRAGQPHACSSAPPTEDARREGTAHGRGATSPQQAWLWHLEAALLSSVLKQRAVLAGSQGLAGDEGHGASPRGQLQSPHAVAAMLRQPPRCWRRPRAG